MWTVWEKLCASSIISERVMLMVRCKRLLGSHIHTMSMLVERIILMILVWKPWNVIEYIECAVFMVKMIFCSLGHCRDVSSVELLMNNHQGIKAEIDARNDSFTACIELGKSLLARKHYASEEVRNNCASLHTLSMEINIKIRKGAACCPLWPFSYPALNISLTTANKWVF